MDAELAAQFKRSLERFEATTASTLAALWTLAAAPPPQTFEYPERLAANEALMSLAKSNALRPVRLRILHALSAGPRFSTQLEEICVGVGKDFTAAAIIELHACGAIDRSGPKSRGGHQAWQLTAAPFLP